MLYLWASTVREACLGSWDDLIPSLPTALFLQKISYKIYKTEKVKSNSESTNSLCSWYTNQNNSPMLVFSILYFYYWDLTALLLKKRRRLTALVMETYPSNLYPRYSSYIPFKYSSEIFNNTSAGITEYYSLIIWLRLWPSGRISYWSVDLNV